jgi:protein-S-isoprenylcysteine O-methyltransferase Ste14
MTEGANSEGRERAARLISRWARLSIVCLGLVVLLSLWWNAAWTPERIAGACLIVAGIAGWITAQFQLGDSFSVRPEARALVTRGIYSRIRNPIYVFSALLLSGVVLYVEKPAWLALLVILIPVQVMRARREASVLEEKFGEEYRTYRRMTWF